MWGGHSIVRLLPHYNQNPGALLSRLMRDKWGLPDEFNPPCLHMLATMFYADPKLGVLIHD